MIRPLIWKEWCEQRWKMAFGTLMLLTFAGSFVAARIASAREVMVVIWVLGGLVLGLYSAMGVFAPERSTGTTTFLASRPIEPWKVFVCKWFFGWFNVAVPMAACSLCLLVIAGASQTPDAYGVLKILWSSFAGIMLATIFYTMTCCLAPRKSGEAFVGFVGLLVFFAMIVHIMITEVTGLKASPAEPISIPQEMFLFVNPLHWVSLIQPHSPKLHESVLVIEQAALFAVAMWIGLRKWKRSC